MNTITPAQRFKLFEIASSAQTHFKLLDFLKEDTLKIIRGKIRLGRDGLILEPGANPMPLDRAENFIYSLCRVNDDGRVNDDAPDVDGFLKSLGIEVANDQGPMTNDKGHGQDAHATP